MPSYMKFSAVKYYFQQNDIVTSDGLRWYDTMFSVSLTASNMVGEYVINTILIEDVLTENQWRAMQCAVTTISDLPTSHILDCKSVVVENFKESIRQYLLRKGRDNEADRYLIETQTYYGLLIQFGMGINELEAIENAVRAKYEQQS